MERQTRLDAPAPEIEKLYGRLTERQRLQVNSEIAAFLACGLTLREIAVCERPSGVDTVPILGPGGSTTR